MDKIAKFLATAVCRINFVSYFISSLSDFLRGLKEGWEESQSNPTYDKKQFNKVTKEYLDNE